MRKIPKIVYSPEYEINIGAHVFPTSKYRLVKEYLTGKGYIGEDSFTEPQPASIEDLLQVHKREYVGDIKDGTLSITDQIRLELPYSESLARASFLCCGGTVLACSLALEYGAGIHLGGGFHHAYPDHGEGFCVFNDVALGALEMLRRGRRVLIIDCDLHQGNGTAVCLRSVENVYTFSIHQENNYPFYKERSDRDIGLKDGTDGKEYNGLLEDNISEIKKAFNPDLIIYVAGADVYRDDQLGGLSLGIGDLIDRDRIIYRESVADSIPAAVVLAGGYARKLEDTVQIHANTVINMLGLGA
ncbi:MAG: histone deacetylase [Elusimicrobia bacterium]|nr:histone deacetylase [Elusimicrobiota bacterium]